MAQPRVLILRAPGTNCDRETAFAFQQAGALTVSMHINQLLETPELVSQYQVLCLPGGFSYGDDVAAGRILANQIQFHLRQVLQDFRAADKLVLGICNGFQVLIKSGILTDDPAQPSPTPSAPDQSAPDQSQDDSIPPVTLTWNDSGKFIDRWVRLRVEPSECVFLRDIESLYLPIAHAEGKFVFRDDAVRESLQGSQQLALRYDSLNGASASSAEEVLPFPANPNGSQLNVAGICDSTGRIFGLMPHPERYIDPTHHPRWTRGEGGVPDGQRIFQNAVRYFA